MTNPTYMCLLILDVDFYPKIVINCIHSFPFPGAQIYLYVYLLELIWWNQNIQ